MKLVIFGLTVSSSWGNGHATLWRGLCKSLSKLGHSVVFFERDVPYYANTRDLFELPGGGELILYSDWSDAVHKAREHLTTADVGMITSYCSDAMNAFQVLFDSCVNLRVFYDLDAPVTLARLTRGEQVDYVGPRGYLDYDLVLSYTGGRTLDELRSVLSAQQTEPLYGSVDPAVHHPVDAEERYSCDLSYMGTWSADREDVLRALFEEPARRLQQNKFLLGGAKYESFDWQPNVYFVNHLPPAEHPSFFCSSRLTLNVTRRPMADMGYCPSGRLFEAAACGVPVLSDWWDGLDTYYKPGSEILVARSTEEAIRSITTSGEELARIGRMAREKTLACHTSDVRARELERILERASHSLSRSTVVEANAVCGA